MSYKNNVDTERIDLKVLSEDNEVVLFRLKKHASLRKLMNAYSDRVGLSRRELRFFLDGSRINENDTPISLELEDGCIIEVYRAQTIGP